MIRWRAAWPVAAAILLGLLAVVAVAAVGVAGATGEIYPVRAEDAPPVPVTAPPVHQAGRPTAVVVLGPAGANAADVLAPYEVLAESGLFNLYTVAAQRRPVALTGGLDLVPDLTFDQLADRVPATPDVIIVPQLTGAGERPTAAVEDWLRQQRADGDPLLVSVCTGAEVLAAAGLLDGRPATSHWLGLIGLRRDYPQVRWRDGVRFVDDGDVITTAGVLSGVDGVLRVIERTSGQDAAEPAARAVNWPDYSPGAAAAIKPSRPAPADVVGLLSAGFRWDRPNMGVLLTDGVGEIELASAFRPYTELSYLARPIAVTLDGQPIRSRHGLTFAPRAALPAAASRLDRLVVPGADAARRATDRQATDRRATAARDRPGGADLAPVYLHDRPGFAFDAVLRDIARTRDVATARWVAKTLQYPSTNPDLSGPAWPWALVLRPILIAAAAAGATAVTIRFWRRRQRDRVRPDPVARAEGDL